MFYRYWRIKLPVCYLSLSLLNELNVMIQFINPR